jgi:hypothetical protein
MCWETFKKIKVKVYHNRENKHMIKNNLFLLIFECEHLTQSMNLTLEFEFRFEKQKWKEKKTRKFWRKKKKKREELNLGHHLLSGGPTPIPCTLPARSLRPGVFVSLPAGARSTALPWGSPVSATCAFSHWRMGPPRRVLLLLNVRFSRSQLMQNPVNRIPLYWSWKHRVMPLLSLGLLGSIGLLSGADSVW